VSVPTRGAELAAQLRLAVPLAALQVGLVFMGLVDTILLGHYSPDAMAGAGIGTGLIFALTVLGLGVVMGLDPLVAQAIGAGDARRTPALLRDGLRVAVRIGVAITAVAITLPWAIDAAGVDRAIADEARVFTLVRLIGITPFLATVALRSFLQAHGHTRPLVIAVVVGNLVNAILDWVLIFGDRGLVDLGLPAIGLPALGSIGAGAATSIVTVAMLVYYQRAARPLVAALGGPSDAPDAAPAILRLGAPIGLQLFAEVAAFALAALLAGRLGPVPAAAHQIALQLASVSFSIALGVGSAAAIRVGIAVGAGEHAWARRAAGTSLILGLAVMSMSALLFVAVPGPLARLFGDRGAVTATAITLIQIAAVFQLSDGAQAVATGALRGAGDTRAAFVANLIGHYAIGFPIAMTAAFVFDRGAAGLWWGLTAGLTGTAIALCVRLAWLTGRPITRAADR